MPTNELTKREAELSRKLIRFLSEFHTSEPLVAEEIAAALHASIHDVHRCLRVLVGAGRIKNRKETQMERTLRFGGPQTASPANLYSMRTPVPERKTRQLVRGVVAEMKPRSTSTRAARNETMAEYFGRRSVTRPFNITEASDATGVSTTALYKYVSAWVELGLVRELDPSKKRFRKYKVIDKNALLRRLGVDVDQPELPSAPAYRAPTTPVPGPDEGKILVSADHMRTVLNEVERLRAENAALRELVAATPAGPPVLDLSEFLKGGD